MSNDNKIIEIKGLGSVLPRPTPISWYLNTNKSACKQLHPIPFSEGPVNGDSKTKPWEKRIVYVGFSYCPAVFSTPDNGRNPHIYTQRNSKNK